MKLLQKFKEISNDEKSIDFSIEGENIKIFYKNKNQIVLNSVIEPQWSIYITIDNNFLITNIKTIYNSNFRPIGESLKFHTLTLSEIMEVKRLEFKEFYNDINKCIIAKYGELFKESNNLIAKSQYINNSILKVYETLNYNSYDTSRVGKDTITNSSSSISYNVIPNDIGIENIQKYNEIVKRIKELSKYESNTEYSYSRAGHDINITKSMCNYPLTNIANQMYRHSDGLRKYDTIFLEEVVKKMSMDIVDTKNNPFLTLDNIRNIRSNELIHKLGIARIIFLKFLLICLFDKYEKLKIDDLFFWNYCYFLTNKSFYFQVYTRNVFSEDFYRINQQKALDKVFKVLVENLSIIDGILKNIMNFEKLELTLIDYIEHENENYQFDINDIAKRFNCILK